MSASPPNSGFVATTDGGLAASHPPVENLSVLAGPATGREFNAIRIALVPVACWRMGDLRFHFDSSFILPEARSEFQVLSRIIEDNKEALTSDAAGTARSPSLSIFGHADPVGNDEYNKNLSGRRAAAVYAALTRKTEIWEDLFSNTGVFTQVAPGDKWGDTVVQIMRTSLKKTESGRTTAPQRKQLFLEYMNFLCIDDRLKPFQVDRKTGFLGGEKDKLGKGDYQGCGEFNPVLIFSRADTERFAAQPDHEARDDANAPNRRVMVLLFRPGAHVTPNLWPCPRAKETTAACRTRFWSDAEVRRSVQEKQREFKDKEDTFACRFYQRLVMRSPCEKDDESPLAVALFDTLSDDRDTEIRLVVFDGSGQEVFSIPGENATDRRDGTFLFVIDPKLLPDPVQLQWHTREGNSHLAGPCSPTELRRVLAALDLDKGHALVGNPRKPQDPPPMPRDPSDDVLVNIITDGADGGSPA